MQCPKCRFENREGVKFCEECGTKMELVCPGCGAKAPPGSKFCGECGHPLSAPAASAATPQVPLPLDPIAKLKRYLPTGLAEKILAQRDRIEGEKRQVTVLFCDLAGYTPLTEKLGPEEAYALMDRVYEILIHKVHDFEGTVNEMTGDGILGLFGAPIALEDAPSGPSARPWPSTGKWPGSMSSFKRKARPSRPFGCGWASTRDRSWSGPWAMTCGWISRSWAIR